MKRVSLYSVFILLSFCCFSQVKIKNRKYPSLLWEISGNGLKKPSYLFGTMHVSSKIAFYLSDSFYVAIKSADVVALETNPESWQADMDRYEVNDYRYNSRWDEVFEVPNDYLTLRSLRIGRYEKLLEQALFSQPSVINNLLYRSYSEKGSDFEEDTYLDMYIYQAGKKLGKRVAGVEDYGESMRLMAEAYRDASRDRNTRDRTYDSDDVSPDKLQEAYRSGNLDLLDSLNRLSSYSEAFDEKFLYRRNEIQAASIDSILRKSSLFVGIGAAHLPGYRGVIELLRKKGYRLRPIMMGARDSRQKEQVEKLKVPVTFSTHTSPDGFFKVDIPGKFYRFSEYSILDQEQYADMANGCYYMVTRVKTNSLFWGHDPGMVARKIDSVLYENVPGRIISKTAISRNGYPGIDILNRTRRGDYQRYHIFITPFEVLFFKMGGNGEYVKNGEEAGKYFKSIQLKESRNGGWKKFQPQSGGFSVLFPQEPFENLDNRVEYDALDLPTGTHFKVLRTDVHNYHFTEEDTFDLSLMEESFASSFFIDKAVSREPSTYRGYPSLDCKYRHRDGSLSRVRFIIQGAHYYMLVAHGKSENPGMDQFLNSFEFQPYQYGDEKLYTDTSFQYTVKTTWYPAAAREKIEVPDEYSYGVAEEDTEWWDKNDYKSKLLTNDTTGEKILVACYRSPRYFYSPDSALLDEKTGQYSPGLDTSWIIRTKTVTELPNKMKVWETIVTDTNSSRTIHTKIYYRNGVGYLLMTQGDTLTPASSFVKNFFESFRPADTLTGINPFEKKSSLYFNDLFHGDSAVKKKAARSISLVQLDSTDIPQLSDAIYSFRWSDHNYLDIKKQFISKLGSIGSKKSSDLLNLIYYHAGDTVQFQYAALEALLRHRTQYAYNLFRDIITTEPPVLENSGSEYYLYNPGIYPGNTSKYFSDYSNGNFLDELTDTLALTRSILPDLLPLVNLDDYKWPVMRILRMLVDSHLVSPKEYEIYFSKFLIEAKQEMRKQTIEEKKKSIEKAEENKQDKKPNSKDEIDAGNEKLVIYATLLLPFYDTHPNVAPLVRQLLSSADRRLKYNVMILLMRRNRLVPDSMIGYFASLDNYRYELYTDLNKLNKKDQFPAAWNNHTGLCKSRLLSGKTYGAPDSLDYIDRLSVNFQGKNGFIYFFRYKQKKDDLSWKLASAGLVPVDPLQFEFSGDTSRSPGTVLVPYRIGTSQLGDQFNFTGFWDEKINLDEPVGNQLTRQWKKLVFSKRKSGKMFFSDNRGDYDDAGDYPGYE